MAKFRGVYPTTIDGKGRTSFPARFREILVESFGDDRFFLTNSSPVDLGGGIHSSGLLIFPYREFSLFEEKFQDSKGLTPVQRESIINIIINPAVELSAIEKKLRQLYLQIDQLLGNRFGNGLLISFQRSVDSNVPMFNCAE